MQFLLQNNLGSSRLTFKGGGGADKPLFEIIKTNAGTQPKNELQQ